MNPLIITTVIASITAIVVALISGYSAKRAAADARDAAREAREAATSAAGKVDTVIHMVDGTQTKILAQLEALTEKSAGLAGELKGRDYTRLHMEDRQDKLAQDAKVAGV